MSIQHAKSFFRPVDPIEAIRLIHRQMDGVITFHRTRQGEFKNLFGLKADETQQLLPPKMDELRTDAYFSLNAFWYNQQFGYVPAYRARRTERLRYLCTCFCDLDCYNANLTPNQAFTRVLAMEQSNAIPPISALVNSGRGVWVLWLLGETERSWRAPRAFPEKIVLYDPIQDELHRRLSHLGAEAKDACRVARVPDSINSKSRTPVIYEFRFIDDDGPPLTYTLKQLAAELGLMPMARTSSASSRGSKPVTRRRNGYDALAHRRLEDFELLLGNPRRFPPGRAQPRSDDLCLVTSLQSVLTGQSPNDGDPTRARMPPTPFDAGMPSGSENRVRHSYEEISRFENFGSAAHHRRRIGTVEKATTAVQRSWNEECGSSLDTQSETAASEIRRRSQTEQ